jgi:hypothetical protein
MMRTQRARWTTFSELVPLLVGIWKKICMSRRAGPRQPLDRAHLDWKELCNEAAVSVPR